MAVPSELNQACVVVLDEGGQPLSFASEGWTHFGHGS